MQTLTLPIKQTDISCSSSVRYRTLSKMHQHLLNRGVSGYLKLGGQVVMWRAAAATPPSGGAFYSATLPTHQLRPCKRSDFNVP